MERAVYVLCAVTALTCAILLFRGWLRTHARLLIWCAAFFLTLAVENGILFVDLMMGPTVDLSPLRNGVALAGMGAFLFGLTWETK